jgi:hypothetical protein
MPSLATQHLPVNAGVVFSMVSKCLAYAFSHPSFEKIMGLLINNVV